MFMREIINYLKEIRSSHLSFLFPLFSFLFPLSSFLFPLSSFLFFSCGGGDDDGRRLGELIVGTWQRGWGEEDVIIEGDTDIEPENFAYDTFVFMSDGKYNGMVRDGSFLVYDDAGDVLYEGQYRCDNSNLRLEFVDGTGKKQKILAQVLSFTDDMMTLRYENEDYNVTVTLILRKSTP